MVDRYWARSGLLVVASVLLVLVSNELLGAPFGWSAPGREAAGLLVGHGIPLLQLIALAMLTDQLMWALPRAVQARDQRRGSRAWRCRSSPS